MYYISVSWPRAKGELWQPLKYSKGNTLEKVVYTKRNQNWNQLNERNIIIKKWYMHVCDKKKYINCGQIPPAEIFWFNCYQVNFSKIKST